MREGGAGGRGGGGIGELVVGMREAVGVGGKMGSGGTEREEGDGFEAGIMLALREKSFSLNRRLHYSHSILLINSPHRLAPYRPKAGQVIERSNATLKRTKL